MTSVPGNLYAKNCIYKQNKILPLKQRLTFGTELKVIQEEQIFETEGWED
jgi:hypothetical protein